MGRLIVHEEVPGTNIGLEKHVNQSLRPRLLSNKYVGYKVAMVGDPAGVAKGNISEESCFDALKRLGLPAFPAMSGGYRFTKTKAGALRVVPEKNDKEGYSHVADCLQYASLVVGGGLMGEIARRLRGRTRPAGPTISAAAWT